jgi:hypothetical protein
VFAGRNDIKHASQLGFQRRFSAVSARPLSVRYGCHVHSHPMLRKTWRKGSGCSAGWPSLGRGVHMKLVKMPAKQQQQHQP